VPVLDTTFLIDLKRGLPAALAALEHLERGGEPLVVPMQAAIEYAAGITAPPEAFAELSEAFDLSAMNEAAALVAAELAQRALDLGNFPGWADIQIAADAHRRETYLVTADARGFRTLGVRVWAYRQEPEPPR
jgi:predicted nucleic acid-binding protein